MEGLRGLNSELKRFVDGKVGRFLFNIDVFLRFDDEAILGDVFEKAEELGDAVEGEKVIFDRFYVQLRTSYEYTTKDMK